MLKYIPILSRFPHSKKIMFSMSKNVILPLMRSGTLSSAKWIRTGISGLGMSARLDLILCKCPVTWRLVYSRAISLPLSNACWVKEMQWSVICDSWSSATFFSCSVFCFWSQTSVSFATSCLPLTFIVFVSLKQMKFEN